MKRFILIILFLCLAIALIPASALVPDSSLTLDNHEVPGFNCDGVKESRNTTIMVLFDHPGTTKMLTNNWGTVTWPHPAKKVNKVLPFGKDLDLNPDTLDPVQEAYKLTFTGKELDKTLDLHYFGARYYNASLPRFLSPDPVGGTPGNPLSWNRYLYCRNDPVNRFDPDGRVAIVDDVAFWTAAGLTMAIVYVASPSPLDPNRTNGKVIVDSAIDVVDQTVDFVNNLFSENSKDITTQSSGSGETSEAGSETTSEGSEISKTENERKEPGADGATSKHIIEKKGGETISVTHKVTDPKTGEVKHQHQTHIGKYGTRKVLPDEWVEHPEIGTK